MKKILVLCLLTLVISCGQKNYSKMSIEELQKEGLKYQEKFLNNSLGEKEKLELEKIKIIYQKKEGFFQKKINKVDVDMKKDFKKMSMDELDSYIDNIENELYEKGNISLEKMKKREEALQELEVKQNERTKQLMEERIKKTKENAKKSKGIF